MVSDRELCPEMKGEAVTAEAAQILTCCGASMTDVKHECHRWTGPQLHADTRGLVDGAGALGAAPSGARAPQQSRRKRGRSTQFKSPQLRKGAPITSTSGPRV